MDRDLKHAVEYIPGKLYYLALTSAPSGSNSNRHFFCVDSDLIYWNFYLDFGPLNLGQLYRFCQLLNKKLKDERLKDKVIYYYSSTHAHKRTNAAFLISAWAMLYMGRSPDEAFAPFHKFPTPFPPWHDATPTICTYNLTILDTLRGLYKAREHGFFNFENFNIEEYEHFEQVENGDLNWLQDGKWVAFAGPHATRDAGPGGYYTLRPEDYVPYFKRTNVQLVVRLNKPYYDARKFTSQGIGHMDLYFTDGSNPPEHILNKFIERCEAIPGAIAVHCKAGLGRTGTCIGCYIMKHYRFTAEEMIGWFRIVRPGSIIGPQQQFMKEMQPRMWRAGELMRASVPRSLASDPSAGVVATRSSSRGSSNRTSSSVGNGKVAAALSDGSSSNSSSSSNRHSIASASGSSQSSTRSKKVENMSISHNGAASSSSSAAAAIMASSSGRYSGGGSGGAGQAATVSDSMKSTQGDQLRARRAQHSASQAAHLHELSNSSGSGKIAGGDSRRVIPAGVAASGSSGQQGLMSGSNARRVGDASSSSPSTDRKSSFGSFLSSWNNK